MAMEKTSLVDVATERIKQYIQENNLKPNDKFLTEKELTDQLQVSRTVVREALITLQSVGILTIKTGGGIYIDNPNLNSIKTILKHHYDTYGVKIKELIETRKIIELGTLRLIIEKEENIDLTYLKQINKDYYNAIINNGDIKMYDQAFHRQLMKETANNTFYTFGEIIKEYFSLVKIDLIRQEDELLQSYQEHAAMLDAIENNDLTAAQQIMAVHFEPIFTFIEQMEETI
ncbi:FadR family transcriptional regulator [Virgibacillus sp. NKC19-3]|nr:FadR family transcriptional regulator [Virgibacillus sp. NKC19-3]